MPTGAALIRDAHRHMIHAEGEPGGRRDERIRRGAFPGTRARSCQESPSMRSVTRRIAPRRSPSPSSLWPRTTPPRPTNDTSLQPVPSRPRSPREVLRPEPAGVDLGPFGDRREFVRLEAAEGALRGGDDRREPGGGDAARAADVGRPAAVLGDALRVDRLCVRPSERAHDVGALSAEHRPRARPATGSRPR